ncbi:hypothetical protein V5O48_014932 [Marasmius crinis-equi]|uniref:FAD-binding PCMH-type domain-containing protein n=1 Tax=Marasmius crinis-equi TaxID=585013 RepID=A0ABR3EVW0_9AGAR
MADTEQRLKELGFTGSVITTTSTEYDVLIQRYPQNAILKPSYILLPQNLHDLPKAIQFARSHNPPLEIAVKGGGVMPYPSASSDGGLVIDLSQMKEVVVAEDKKSVTVGGGALWSDVYAETDKHGVVPIGGNVHFLGVGGFTLAGGYSHLSGKYGLGVDNIIEASVALADGRVVTASEKNEPDLFWAIRGGVNQFGIVGQLVLKTYPLPGPMTVGAIVYPGTELQKVMSALHPGVLILPYIENNQTPPDSVLSPFRDAQPIFEGLGTVDGFTAVSHAADEALAGAPPRLHIDGALFSDAWDDTITSVFVEWMQFTEQPEFKASTCMWELGHRDKIAEKKTGDTAFPARSPHYYLVVTARNTDPTDDSKAKEWASKVASSVRRAQVEKTGKALTTPASFALSPETVKVEDVFGENLPRLKELKAKYDPERVWSRGWVI